MRTRSAATVKPLISEPAGGLAYDQAGRIMTQWLPDLRTFGLTL